MKIVIFDFDNTLLDCGKGKPREDIVALAKSLSDKAKLVCLTSRYERMRDEVSEWLNQHVHSSFTLLMRTEGDDRGNADVKRDILKQLDKNKIWFAVDDLDENVNMYRAEGITCFHCGEL